MDTEEIQKIEVKPEKQTVVVSSPLDSPLVIETDGTLMAAATDVGTGRAENHDGVVVHVDGNEIRVVVIDGVGRWGGEGKKATEAAFVRAYEEGMSDEVAVKIASDRLADSGSDACFLAINIRNNRLEMMHAGDVHFWLVRGEKVEYQSEDHNPAGMPDIVTNTIAENKPTHDSPILLMPGDRLIIASDFVEKNYRRSVAREAAIVNLTTARKPSEAIEALGNPDNSGDNRAIVIIDIGMSENSDYSNFQVPKIVEETPVLGIKPVS